MTFKELKKWYKERKTRFYSVDQLKGSHPEVLEAFERELSKNSGKVGCFVYHSHIKENDRVVFEGMKVGYYVRSKNPFSRRFKKTYGNF